MPQNLQTETAPLIDISELPSITAPEHEFVRLIVHEGKTASDAYKGSHDCRGLTDAAVWNRASRLRGSDRIREWESSLISWGMARGALSHEQYVTEMQALSRRAERAGNYGASVNAMREAGQAAGLKETKIEVTHKTDASMLIEQLRDLFGLEHARQAALELGLVLDGEYEIVEDRGTETP